MKLIFCILLITLTGCVTPSRWNTETKVTEAAYQTLNVVDTLQTMRVARHPDQWGESTSTWVIGEHPSQSKVVAWGLIKAAGHSFVTNELVTENVPQPIIRAWQWITLLDITYAVNGNYRIGLGFGF